VDWRADGALEGRGGGGGGGGGGGKKAECKYRTQNEIESNSEYRIFSNDM
jgi:hypothetical protein